MDLATQYSLVFITSCDFDLAVYRHNFSLCIRMIDLRNNSVSFSAAAGYVSDTFRQHATVFSVRIARVYTYPIKDISLSERNVNRRPTIPHSAGPRETASNPIVFNGAAVSLSRRVNKDIPDIVNHRYHSTCRIGKVNA